MPADRDMIGIDAPTAPAPEPTEWLDLHAVADVAIVSAGRRITPEPGVWSMDAPGEQIIDITFHRPTAVGRLRIVCVETEQARTQELTVWASVPGGEQHRERIRQQFNFSPAGATEEYEEFVLSLPSVSAVVVRIVPSIDGRPAIARVRELRISAVAVASQAGAV